MPHPFDDQLDMLRMSMERTATWQADAGPWVVLGVVPMRDGPVATPLLGGSRRFTMRRFASAEEAIANSVAMPAAKAYGGWAVNIETGETVRIAPYAQHQQP